MIEVKNLIKSFDGRPVLKNLSVSFKPGVTNLIIGGSGSGKTTLIKCMVGLHEIDGGDILYNNRNYNGLNFDERKPIRQEIGMLFQAAALFDSLNVEENVMFPLRMFTAMTHEERRERVNFCLKRVNLNNANKLMPSELSGGMKKRVGIARAIAMQPKYLFCDEPNSGLDPKTSTVIDELIQEITHEYNITTVMNTHDMNSVMEIGDHIIFLFEGQKWWEGTKDEVRHTDNQQLNDFVFATKFLQNLRNK